MPKDMQKLLGLVKKILPNNFLICMFYRQILIMCLGHNEECTTSQKGNTKLSFHHVMIRIWVKHEEVFGAHDNRCDLRQECTTYSLVYALSSFTVN